MRFFTGDAVLDFLIYGTITLVLGVIGYQVWWHSKYRKEYSEVREDKGIVTDMDYTPSRYNHHTKTHSSEEHDVFIKFEKLGEEQFDDEDLYQAVRLDDEVKAEYQEVYKVEKANPNNREFMHNNVISVISPKGRRVEL